MIPATRKPEELHRQMCIRDRAVSEALPEMRRTGSLREVTRVLREKKPESYFEVER